MISSHRRIVTQLLDKARDTAFHICKKTARQTGPRLLGSQPDDDPKAQAQFCFGHLGPHVGLMVDVETEPNTGSKPSLQQNVAFVKNFRALGGIVHLNYLPHWYWHDVWGGPDLAPLKNLGLALVSSNFASFATHAGWGVYGGWAPTIWQYSDSVSLHGKTVDFNAFLGSGATDIPTLVEEFKSLVMTGKITGRIWQETGHIREPDAQ